MGIIDAFLVGIGLSMDAFAVSVCKGTEARDINWKRALVTAFAFGFFQAGMPLLGWLLGSSVQSFIEPVSDWIAFALLAAIGAKMIWDAFHDDACECTSKDSRSRFLAETLLLAIATSIDAFVAGISFAMAGVADIWVTVLVIGVTTFVFSLVGTVVGNKFGARFEKGATIAGGVCLILLGVKILVEHFLG